MADRQQGQYGYTYGDQFGNPNEFTRSTGEDELNRFNQYLRSTPEWQQIKGSGYGFSEDQQNQLSQALAAKGITVPHDFHIDEAGNFNQKSRTKRNLILAAAIGGGALTAGLAGPAIMGALGAGGTVGGSSGAAAGGLGFGAGTGALTSGIATAAPGLMGGATLGASAATSAALAGGAGLASSTLKDTLMSRLGKQEVGDALSRGMGGASQAMASNRGTAAELQLDANSSLERELLAREEEKRKAQAQAYQNMIRGSMAANWQPAQAPRAGINVVRFGGPNGPANDQAKSAGQQLYDQGKSRMGLSDLANPTELPNYHNLMQDPEFLKNLKAGKLEKIFGIGSAVSPIASALLGRYLR